MLTAFQMTLENAILFFEVCGLLHLDTEEERITLMQAMAKMGKVDCVWTTERTKEQFIEDLTKHYNVLMTEGKRA